MNRARQSLRARQSFPGRQRLFVLSVALAIVVLAARTPQARVDDSPEKQVKDATAQSEKASKAFETIMQNPDQAIPQDLLARAKAIAVFPEVVKVAFIGGGGGGKGVVSRHVGAKWGDPVFFRAHGGSVGPQIGASKTDFVLLLMDDQSIEALMKDKFEVGAEVRAAAGPVGRTHEAANDPKLQSDILSYSRSRGLFAGVDVKGVVVRPDDDMNKAVYNHTARELLSDQSSGAATGSGLKAFPETLGRYASKAGESQ
jgi:SH3 domain-containing YSC84-like protein 1